jgi:hypothetical protein
VSRSGASYAPNFPGADEGTLWVTNHWYPQHNSVTTTALPANGVIHTTLLSVQVAHTFQSIGINVSVASVLGVCDLGIYSDNGSGYPNALLFHTGAVVSTVGTGAITSALVAALAVGLYHVAVDYSGSTTAPTVTVDNGNYAALLGSTTAGSAAPQRGYIVTAQPATLPATFPAGATAGQVTTVQVQA